MRYSLDGVIKPLSFNHYPKDREGYPAMLVWHMDLKKFVWIKRDGYYPDIQRMIKCSL